MEGQTRLPGHAVIGRHFMAFATLDLAAAGTRTVDVADRRIAAVYADTVDEASQQISRKRAGILALDFRSYTPYMPLIDFLLAELWLPRD
jgi:hypothetical protein